MLIRSSMTPWISFNLVRLLVSIHISSHFLTFLLHFSLPIPECPPEFRSDRMGKVATDKAGKITVDTLAALRTRLNNLKVRIVW